MWWFELTLHSWRELYNCISGCRHQSKAWRSEESWSSEYLHLAGQIPSVRKCRLPSWNGSKFAITRCKSSQPLKLSQTRSEARPIVSISDLASKPPMKTFNSPPPKLLEISDHPTFHFKQEEFLTGSVWASNASLEMIGSLFMLIRINIWAW